jgi:hypothetical protein
MKTVHSLLWILLAVISPFAQGRESETDSSSEALMVVRAAGFKVVHDVTPKELEAASRGESPLAAALAALPAGHLENSARFIAWMPDGSAASPKAATEWLAKVWTTAVSKSLPGAHVELKQRDVENKADVRRYIGIDAPDCTGCMMLVTGLDIGRQPKTGKQPEFLGTESSYIWGPPGSRGDGGLAGYPWTAESMTAEDRVDFMKRLSGNLPYWIYLYVPPDAKFYNEPVLFNTGRMLRFIQQ